MSLSSILVRLGLRVDLTMDASQKRSAERQRRIFLSIAAGAGARGITVISGLISIPLTINHLGPERFGMWMTIVTIGSLFVFADLGIGGGLLNEIARAHGRGDVDRAKVAVSSALMMLLALALTLGILFVVVYPRVTWATVFNVQSPIARSEAGPAIAAYATCFLISLPLSIAQRVQTGYQESYRNSVFSAFGGLLGLGGLILAVRHNFGLPWIVLGYYSGPVLGLIAAWISVFYVERPWLRPSWTRAKRGATTLLAKEGSSFFINRIANAAVFSTDNIVIAQVLGATAVAQYAVPSKLFTVATPMLLVALSSMWPAYGEALERGDVDWARRTFRRSLLATIGLLSISSAVLVIYGEEIIARWVGGANVSVTTGLLAALGCWTVLVGVGRCMAAFLNTTSLRFRLITSVLLLATAVPTKLLFADRWGINGMVWGMAILYTVTAVLPYFYRSRSILNDLDNRISYTGTLQVDEKSEVARNAL